MRGFHAALVLFGVAVASGCGGGSTSPAHPEPLTVYAAASLREVLPAIDPSPRYNFAGSDQLAVQIREGAPADVYIAASTEHPQLLFDDGLVEEPVTFASNRLVLLLPKANPAGIATVRDVARAGVTLVVAAEGVPVGGYTRQALVRLGLTDALRNVVSNETDVSGVVGKVSLGEADAGFVYATDAAAAGGDVMSIELPVGAQPPIGYQIAVVASSTRMDAARAFVEKVTGEPGRRTLTSAGFGPP